MKIKIAGNMRYIGKTHGFMRGQTVRIVAVHRGHLADPDTAEIIDKAGVVVETGAQDMVEVAPFVEGRPSWITSDAGVDELATLN